MTKEVVRIRFRENGVAIMKHIRLRWPSLSFMVAFYRPV